VWKSDDAPDRSVFAAADRATPFKVPRLSDQGNWIYFGTVNEQKFCDAAAAKKSIAEVGYYLT
jgi:hypothetical protein